MTVIIHDTPDNTLAFNADAGTKAENGKRNSVDEVATVVIKATAKAGKKSFIGRLVDKVTGNSHKATNKENLPAQVKGHDNKFAPLPIKVKRPYRQDQRIPAEFIPNGEKVYHTPQFVPVAERTKSGKHVFVDAQIMPVHGFPIVPKRVPNPKNQAAVASLFAPADAPAPNPVEPAHTGKTEVVQNATGTMVCVIEKASGTAVTAVPPAQPSPAQPIPAPTVKPLPVQIATAKTTQAPILMPAPAKAAAPAPVPALVSAPMPALVSAPVHLTAPQSRSVPAQASKIANQALRVAEPKKSFLSRIASRVWTAASGLFKAIAKAARAVVNWPVSLVKRPKVKKSSDQKPLISKP